MLHLFLKSFVNNCVEYFRNTWVPYMLHKGSSLLFYTFFLSFFIFVLLPSSIPLPCSFLFFSLPYFSQATSQVPASGEVFKKPLHRTSSRRKLNAMRSEEEKLYGYREKSRDIGKKNLEISAEASQKKDVGSLTSSNFPDGGPPDPSSTEASSLDKHVIKNENKKRKSEYPYEKKVGSKKRKKKRRKTKNYSCRLSFAEQSIYHYGFDRSLDDSSYDQQVASSSKKMHSKRGEHKEERKNDNEDIKEEKQRSRFKPSKLQQRYWICDGYWRNYPSSELHGPIFLYLGNANDTELEKDMEIHNEYVKFYEELKATFQPSTSSER